MKCDTCCVKALAEKLDEPCACVWYLNFVVCGDKNVEDCTAYIPLEGVKEEPK